MQAVETTSPEEAASILSEGLQGAKLQKQKPLETGTNVAPQQQ
jgi:hypothetical protein